MYFRNKQVAETPQTVPQSLQEEEEAAKETGRKGQAAHHLQLPLGCNWSPILANEKQDAGAWSPAKPPWPARAWPPCPEWMVQVQPGNTY